MYLQHFGLTQLPFTLTPNTAFFLALPCHVEALQVLQTALQTGEGFIKVTGEVGTGKTLLLRKLMNELPAPLVCAYLPNPSLSGDELRWALALELGLKYAANIDGQQLTALIQQQLLALSAHGQQVVLLLDEAQVLSDESLETLRLFTNLETESRKLLQVVLFGQPELDQRLAQPHLRQLRQRISFSYRLQPLNRAQVAAYVEHRLTIAGADRAVLIKSAAIDSLTQGARGIPRLVNILMHKGLMLAFGQGCERVTAAHIKAAIKDTEDASQAPSFNQITIAGLLILLLMSFLWWFGGYL